MKCFINLLFPVAALLLFQSCDKKDDGDTRVIDPLTYSSSFNWREDSIKAGNAEAFSKIENGNVFTWLANSTLVSKSEFAIYRVQSNIQADFAYTVTADSVIALKLTNDSIYFYDKENHLRTDLFGKVTYSPEASLVLFNTAVSPGITIKYKLETK
ncbi:hypothetical protein [Chitinophaga sp.]|uniref:hypothetical protein n=1 Tax=Chitinophaga sp. TaxID=1869181 RepID=UPI0031E271E4